MEKAIHTVTPAALSSGTQPVAPDHEGVAHALGIAGRLLAQMTVLPFATEIGDNHPGWRVHFKFRDSSTRGLLQLAELVDTPVSRAETAFGVHIEARANVEGVEILASTILTAVQAAALDAETSTPAADEQDEPVAEEDEPVDAGPAAVVPLGTAILNRSVVAAGTRAEQ